MKRIDLITNEDTDCRLTYHEIDGTFVFRSYRSNAVFEVFQMHPKKFLKTSEWDNATIREKHLISWRHATLRREFKEFFGKLSPHDYKLIKKIDDLGASNPFDRYRYGLDIVFNNKAAAMLFRMSF